MATHCLEARRGRPADRLEALGDLLLDALAGGGDPGRLVRLGLSLGRLEPLPLLGLGSDYALELVVVGVVLLIRVLVLVLVPLPVAVLGELLRVGVSLVDRIVGVLGLTVLVVLVAI